MLERKVEMPSALVSTMEETFKSLADHYIEAAKAHTHLDGTTILDMFKEAYGEFRFTHSIARLQALKAKLHC